MKTKIVAVLFSLMIIGLGAFFFYSKTHKNKISENTKQAKIITPKRVSEEQAAEAASENSFDSETFTSFISLRPSETLISTLILDFDNDTFDDQIIVVRKAGDQQLYIITGIYNKDTDTYERVSEIPTEISKTGTFSYSTMDVIGNHTQSLIYEGIKDDGNSVMKIFSCQKKKDKIELVEIGNFVSDGTVFIQQAERNDYYEMNIANGESHSVWIYSSEPQTENAEGDTKANSAKSTGLNQIQTEYRYNPKTGRYEFNTSITVTAGRLAAKELSRVQDGTVETFANYLNGLWYKTSNTSGTMRYLFFDYEAQEIIFLNDDVEEVYNWENSKIRHNGIYVTTSNTIISSLHRRFDISLTNMDEIRAFIRDDVNLFIGENSLWDGTYKKASQSNFSLEQVKKAGMREKIIKKLWIESLSDIRLTLSDKEYLATNKEGEKEEGLYAFIKIGDELVIQLRPNSGTGKVLDDTDYSLKYGTKVIEETVKRVTTKKTVTDEGTMIMTPVRITPREFIETEGRILTFNLE